MGAVFQFRMRKGRSIGAQAGFADAFNRVLDILENIKGLGGVEIRKNGGNWRVVITDDVSAPESGGIPAGYEEETLNIITDAGIVTRKVLVETATKASVETFASADSRLLLAITTGGVVRKSKGYLKA
ncbi:MAG: hypothetical protein WCY59_07935 [Anaerovoracaceae bacterium]